MKMREFTSHQNEKGETIDVIHFRISDDDDRTKQKEWIEAQFAVAEPLSRNGALLRMKALEKLRETIEGLLADLRMISPQSF